MTKVIQLTLIWAFFLCASDTYTQNNRPVTNNVQDMQIFYHTIESGQTVYSIAKMYDVMVMDIYNLNPGSENGIKAGERLKIPQRKFEEKSILNSKQSINSTNDANAGNDAKTANTTNTAQVNQDGDIIHTIQAKETLYGVAKKYKVSEESILQANPGLSTTNFSTGKKIHIPKPGYKKPIAEVVIRGGAKEVYYAIQQGETIVNICRIFKTTEIELLMLNPELSGGLRAGLTLRIPLRISENELPKGTVSAPPRPIYTDPPPVKLKNAAKIALLLPLDADNRQMTDNKKAIIEYLEGFLLSVDELFEKKQEIELFIEEIGDDNLTKTKKVIQDKHAQLKDVHLIIGVFTNEQAKSKQIRMIADYARENKIKFVIPMSRIEVLTDNPYVFQVNTPPDYLFEKVANAGANLFAKHNIIFLDTKETDDQTTDFLKAYKKELKDRNITFKEATYDASNFEANILSLLSTSKPNMIIPVSQTLDALLKIKPILRLIADTKPEYNLTLFGYPVWQRYIENCLDDFHALNTYIYSYFYADNIHPDVKSFYDKFKYWYSKSPIRNYYKYALFGYDTGMYFLNAIHQYGVGFEENLSEIPYKSLQTGFNFNRVYEGGSFINTNIYIIHYNKDYTITRTEYK